MKPFWRHSKNGWRLRRSAGFGTELEEVGPGRARVTMVCRPEMGNILGMVHGSAIFALIDEAFQAAVNGHGTVAVALNMNLTFHAAPKMGERLTATTRELHSGRRTATYSSRLPTPRRSDRFLPGPGLPQGHAVGVCLGLKRLIPEFFRQKCYRLCQNGFRIAGSKPP